jgi:hypothetical protein
VFVRDPQRLADDHLERRKSSRSSGVIYGKRSLRRPDNSVLAIANFCDTDWKIDMSTITEIQEAIGKLRAKEKSALATWLQSQEEPVLSKSEEAALLARLDKAAAELDAGEGVPLERVREKIRGWAGK